MAYVQKMVIHRMVCPSDATPPEGSIESFHADVIRRRLLSLPLTAAERVRVLDTILEDLRSRERDGRIR